MNVVLLLTDQQRHDAVGYANQLVHTPNLDQLAKQSTAFTRCYAQSPQCQPNRASILTGRYPTAHRVWWNECPLPRSERTIGNYLKDAGFQTAYFGKWHVTDVDGTESDGLLRHFGYDVFWTTRHWMQQLHLVGKNNIVFWDAPAVNDTATARAEFWGPMQKPTWTGRLSGRAGHHDEMVAEKALQYLATTQQPFFLTVGFYGPHPPYAAPMEFSDLYGDLPAPSESQPNHVGYRLSQAEWVKLKQQYYGNVSWIDDNVGRILAALERFPETMVIFTSDHGDILGDHGLFSKGLYGYEGNTRVPLLISWRGLIAQTDRLVQSIDILPTILNAAGIAIPHCVQGQDLYSGSRDYALSMIGFWGYDRLRMLRHGNHKYWIQNGRETMFDLESDPGEERNIADSVSLCDLRKKLVEALIAAEDPCPLPK